MIYKIAPVTLGFGVYLAHIRTGSVQVPHVGGYMLSADVERKDNDPWLWLVVLVPTIDPSRHLGWMAHLAPGLHSQEQRQDLAACKTADELIIGLERLLQHRTMVHRRPATSVPSEADSTVSTPAPSSTASTSAFRMIMAVIKEVEVVDHLLKLFVDHDVRGATVLEAREAAEHLSSHMRFICWL